MIFVRVRYFGILAAHAGRRDETVPLPDGSTVTDLLHRLAQANGDSLGAALFQCNALSPLVRVLHNHLPFDGAGLAGTLADGDEILLFPVVSGGGCKAAGFCHGFAVRPSP